MQPEGAQLTFGYSPILTNVGLNFLPKLDQFVGASIFPKVPVASPVGTYNIWNNGDFLRRNGKELSNYEAAPRGGFATAQGTYKVKNWGVGTPYTALDLANARRNGTSDQKFKNAKVRWTITQGVLEQEFRVKALIETTANWSTTYAGVASAPGAGQFVAWDQTSATPIDDVKAWKRAMRLQTGFEPNKMVIPERIMLALFKNPQILDRVKVAFTGNNGGKPIDVDVDHIRALFNIDIVTPKAVYNSAAEGQAATLVEIWTQTQMWLGYVTATPSTEDPTAGYNFAWTGDTAEGLPSGAGTGEGPQFFGATMNDQGLFMREYPEVNLGAYVIESQLWASPNVVAASLGATFTAVIT